MRAGKCGEWRIKERRYSCRLCAAREVRTHTRSKQESNLIGREKFGVQWRFWWRDLNENETIFEIAIPHNCVISKTSLLSRHSSLLASSVLIRPKILSRVYDCASSLIQHSTNVFVPLFAINTFWRLQWNLTARFINWYEICVNYRELLDISRNCLNYLTVRNYVNISQFGTKRLNFYDILCPLQRLIA